MYKLLWIIPLAIVAAAIWAVSLIPTTVLAWIGGLALILALVAGIGWLILWTYSTAMRS